MGNTQLPGKQRGTNWELRGSYQENQRGTNQALVGILPVLTGEHTAQVHSGTTDNSLLNQRGMTQEPVNQGHTAQPYQPVLMEEHRVQL